MDPFSDWSSSSSDEESKNQQKTPAGRRKCEHYLCMPHALSRCSSYLIPNVLKHRKTKKTRKHKKNIKGKPKLLSNKEKKQLSTKWKLFIKACEARKPGHKPTPKLNPKNILKPKTSVIQSEERIESSQDLQGKMKENKLEYSNEDQENNNIKESKQNLSKENPEITEYVNDMETNNNNKDESVK